MTPERWQRVKEVVAGAIDFAEREARDAFVVDACENDEAFLEEVRSLLARNGNESVLLRVPDASRIAGSLREHGAEAADPGPMGDTGLEPVTFRV